MMYWKEVLKVLNSYQTLGYNKRDTSSIQIGKAPHLGVDAWLHCLYTPLRENEISIIETKLQRVIPSSYKNFLSNCSNGINLFGDAMTLEGLRTSEDRTIDNVFQPYSILDSNTFELPKGYTKDVFIIGHYEYNGALLYIDITSAKVYCTEREKIAPLVEWNTFDEMLELETKRLSGIFNSEGFLEDKDWHLTLPYTEPLA